MTHTIHRPPGMTMTKTNTHTKTNTKCSKDPTYVIFLKSRGFKDIKYDNMSVDQTRPEQTRPDQTIFSKVSTSLFADLSRTCILVSPFASLTNYQLAEKVTPALGIYI